MQNTQNIFRDPIYQTGLVFLLTSVLVYVVPFVSTNIPEDGLMLFFFNYAMAVAYFFVLVANRKTIIPEKKLDYRFLLLIMLLISAYSLNREMNVFESSVNWFSASLVVSCLNYILYSVYSRLPNWARQLSILMAGFSFILFSYLALYLLPTYGIGMVGFLAFGISLHVFVPALFLLNTIFLIKRTSVVQKNAWKVFFTGSMVPLIIALVFTLMWGSLKKDINGIYANQQPGSELPAWIRLAQRIPNTPLAEKMLKSGLVYAVPEITWNDILWRMPDGSFNEEKKHDPLIMCAAFFYGSLKLEGNDLLQILKTNFKFGHQPEDRLWSGGNLITAHVSSNVRVWPACNIAYTEKTITARNEGSRGQEEGIYTFYLSEGAVVSSLSLWINGKEEKGILSTKQKADSAYKAIVGVERRDPSIVHWQEGNRVSLRVFPVLANESRKFKIGITAPLERIKGKLVYENIYFDGPDNTKAKESIQVEFQQPVEEFELPVTFTSKSTQSYNRLGNYEPHWNLVFPDKGLADCSFSFDGNTYSLASYHKRLNPVNVKDLYLDINRAWTRTEFNKIIEASGKYDIYTYAKDLVKITPENQNDLFKELTKDEFSLFPLYKIKDPNSSLLITKGSTRSCNIDDMERTPFIEQTKKFLAGDHKIKLFSIGGDLSPYLKSLKEFRIFQYDNGDLDILSHLLTDNMFVDDTENDDRVIIHKTDMVIERSNGDRPSSGPDHVMRLFAYNHIMQKLGTGLILNRPIEDQLVEEARKAYVVTPLSSLIVLETERDYKRFDIQDSDSSLSNASLGSKGAAPEPHEWLLIITGVLLMTYLKFRRGLKWVKS